ncbi:MAG: hypothetical protein OXI81_01040 [Paracoccaceae bacterium]|nr:hypothetical protein [Paracoccaceae bacterium]MDE2915264.1 hypothetical protein [Paracoccaceae bacterium]
MAYRRFLSGLLAGFVIVVLVFVIVSVHNPLDATAPSVLQETGAGS